MNVILGIDVGTSGTKVLAMDEHCHVVSSNVTEYPLYTPQLGWTQQEPSDWWNAVCQGLKTLTAELPSDCKIVGVGLSGQMHGMVALDKDYQVVRPAILWNDQRTAPQCAEIIALAGGLNKLTSYTNNNMLTGFTAGKILWMKENEPENYAKTVKIINPKDYIGYLLTDVIFTDVSDASGTGFFDVEHKCFSRPLIELCGLSYDLFATPYESHEIVGRVTESASALTGIPAGTPVCAGGGDAVLSTIAMGAGDDQTVAVMVGTSGVVSLHSPAFVPNTDGAVQFSRACVEGLYHVMGVTLAAAGSYKWYGENFGNNDYKGMDKAAETSPAGANGVIFLPYLYGERCPVNDPAAKGCFVGITAMNTMADFNRAVLEGVAFSLRQVYEKISAGKTYTRMNIAGGGSKSPLWRQIFADVFNMEVVTLDGAGEGSGFGATVVAAVGCGMIGSTADASAMLSVKSVTKPNSDNVASYEESYQKYLTLYERLKGL